MRLPANLSRCSFLLMKNAFRKILALIVALVAITCIAIAGAAIVRLVHENGSDIASLFGGEEASVPETGGQPASSLPEDISAVLSDGGDVQTVSEEYYAYSTLSADEKAIYDRICSAFLNFDKEVAIDRCDRETLSRIFYSVISDHADIFWVDGYSYSVSAAALGQKLIFYPTYTMTAEQKQDYEAQVETAVSGWLSGMPAGADDYAKSRYIYETLINRVEYTEGAPENQNILSVFLNGKSVCQGIANAAAVMLQREGIQAAVVRGTANGNAHAWDLVRLDGEYYYFDATWGNSRFLGGSSQSKTVSYAYLNVTSEELSTTHTVTADFAVPDCTATADSYYRREGHYFDSVNHTGLGGLLRRAYSSGEGQCSVKFSSAELFDEAKQYFITEGNFGLYCPGLSQVYYNERRDMLVLTFYYSNPAGG